MLTRLIDAAQRLLTSDSEAPAARSRAARLRTIIDLRGDEPRPARRAAVASVTWPTSWTAPAGDARHPVARPAGERMLPGRSPRPTTS